MAAASAGTLESRLKIKAKASPARLSMVNRIEAYLKSPLSDPAHISVDMRDKAGDLGV